MRTLKTREANIRILRAVGLDPKRVLAATIKITSDGEYPVIEAVLLAGSESDVPEDVDGGGK